MGANVQKEIDIARQKELSEIDFRNRGITVRLFFKTDNNLANFQDIPPNIGNLEKLVKLNLSGNKIKTLPGSIGNLGKLKILLLFNNKLQELPQVWKIYIFTIFTEPRKSLLSFSWKN
jgi:Leucine-rich repeat (LRR) protein